MTRCRHARDSRPAGRCRPALSPESGAKPAPTASRALRDARRGRALSVFPLYAKYLHVAAKVVPQRLVMATWLRMLKRYGG